MELHGHPSICTFTMIPNSRDLLRRQQEFDRPNYHVLEQMVNVLVWRNSFVWNRTTAGNNEQKCTSCVESGDSDPCDRNTKTEGDENHITPLAGDVAEGQSTHKHTHIHKLIAASAA